MKLKPGFLIIAIIIFSCNDHTKNIDPAFPVEPVKAQTGFFPVTDFLNGQITEIKTKGINPLKIVRVNGKDDSSWVKTQQLQAEFSAFLTPVIDSANLAGMFTENTFLDQTLNAFTFTYDPVKPLPDSFLLQRWDIYVDPQKNTVTRIYLIKKTMDHKTMQLTWQADKWCKTVIIGPGEKGNTTVQKEVTIKWDF